MTLKKTIVAITATILGGVNIHQYTQDSVISNDGLLFTISTGDYDHGHQDPDGWTMNKNPGYWFYYGFTRDEFERRTPCPSTNNQSTEVGASGGNGGANGSATYKSSSSNSGNTSEQIECLDDGTINCKAKSCA